MIPRKLHIIWIGQKTPPRRCIDSWRDAHPGWEFKLWDDDAVSRETWELQAQLDCVRELYAKTDLLRWEILYRHGGIYVDADSECVRPLDDSFLTHKNFACWENETIRPGLVAAGYLGAEAGSSLARAWIDECKRVDVNAGQYWETIGPGLLTRLAKNRDDLFIYSARTFIPVHYSGLEAPGSDIVYAKQKWGSTVGYENIDRTVVSVVIPAYNSGPFLDEAIESVLGQTFENWEVIVGAGSLEPCTRACRRNDRRIRTIFIEPRGLADARNQCISQAQGKYIVCLDADDRLDRSYLYRCVLAAAHLERQKPGNPVIVGTDMKEFGERFGHWDIGPERPILKQNCFTYASLYSRALWQKTGGYDAALPWREDWSFWISCAAHEPTFGHISERLLQYRVHPGQLTNKEADTRLSDALVRMRHVWGYDKATVLADIKTIAEAGEEQVATLKRRWEWFPDDPFINAVMALIGAERGWDGNESKEQKGKPMMDAMERVLAE